jgi:hypothetical protein
VSEVQLVFDDLDVNGSRDISYKEFAGKFGYLQRGRSELPHGFEEVSFV